MKFTIIILLIMTLTNISQAQKRAFINGKIFTSNDKELWVEAVLINGDKIEFTGSNKNVKDLIDNNTAIIDLKGKLMLPGFIDNHVHLKWGGEYLLGVNLRDANSKEEFQKRIKDHAEKRKGKWITGGNWDNEIMPDQILPHKNWIDEFTRETPVLIHRYDWHIALANSYALKLAGITKNTKNPVGGIIEKNEKTGEQTGILKDAAITLVTKVIPQTSEEDLEEIISESINEAVKNGFTSVHDITFPEELKIFQKMEREGKLKLRIYSRLPIDQVDNLISAGIEHNFGSEMLKTGSLKAFADGSLGAGTAYFAEPYEDDNENSGLAMEILSSGKLKELSLKADAAKLQLSIHGIGDKANNEILNIFEEAEKQNPKWERRHRLEHAQHLLMEDISRFSKLNVIASVQPYHLFDDGSWAERKIGKDRAKLTYPFKSLIEAGAKICFGSDFPIAPMNALLGIYAAVTRQTSNGKNENGWIPEEKISVKDAVKFYTINNAFAAYEENIKGSIEKGKLADFVILRENIFEIDPQKIKDVKIEMTILGGKIIFKNSE